MVRRSVLALVLFVVATPGCHRKHGDAYKVEAFAAHGARICAAMKDGSMRCWGREGDKAVLAPATVPGAGVVQVCVGDAFTCARTGGGGVSCTGALASAASAVHGATDLACEADRACAVASGEVVCWSAGEAPAPVAGTNGAMSIAAGGGTACVVLRDGVAKCWGHGKRGQLGSGKFEDSDTPVAIDGLEVKAMAVGREHTCALLTNETVACFGSDDDGELGDGQTDASATPKSVPGVVIARQIACGAHHTCARLGDSTVSCWGKNDVHQSGLADAPDLVKPTRVVGLYEATAVVLGDDFTCARMQDGWLRCFGVNDWGQLGDGTTEIRNVPTPIKL